VNELTHRFQRYRECLREIWNRFFADVGDWDARVHFADAAIHLFRGLVLYDFDGLELELLPAYRGDQRPIDTILVCVAPPWDCVKVSVEGTFRDARPLSPEEDLAMVQLAYVDLWDMYPLGHREFGSVCAEVVAGNGQMALHSRIVIPFESVVFQRRT
jgi:hypothetical protein